MHHDPHHRHANGGREERAAPDADPLVPFTVTDQVSAAGLVARMGQTAFQARNLGIAADIWEAEEAVHFARGRNAQAAIRLVFNKVRKTTILGRLAEQGGAAPAAAPALGARLSSRECYQHAIAQGWRALDGTAREEVLQLGLAVLSLRA